MTVQVDIFVLLLTGGFLVIAAFLVPLLFQLKKTAREADEFLAEVRRELVPALREMRESAERFNRGSAHLEHGAEKAERFMESIGEVGESISDVNHFLHRDAARYIGNTAGLWLGIRAASKVLIKGLQNKGG